MKLSEIIIIDSINLKLNESIKYRRGSYARYILKFNSEQNDIFFIKIHQKKVSKIEI